MPTFDIVSKIDGQTLDNAINTAKKEILNRYDFNDSKSSVELDKKTNEITVITENDMRLKAIQDAIISRMVKHNLDPGSMDLGKEETRTIVLTLAPKVYDLVLKYGGTTTGEHNDGIIRTPYLEKQFGTEMVKLFAETKNIFDPLNIFNPGKKVGGTFKDIEDSMLRG